MNQIGTYMVCDFKYFCIWTYVLSDAYVVEKTLGDSWLETHTALQAKQLSNKYKFKGKVGLEGSLYKPPCKCVVL